MHTLLLLLALAAAQPTLDDLSWMTGHWTSTKDGLVMEEVWTEPRGGMILGLHRDARGAKGSFEFLRIAATAEGIVYFAQPAGRPPTPFALRSISGHHVVFANEKHDFPQRITYWREGATLCARVEGEGQPPEQWCWSKK